MEKVKILKYVFNILIFFQRRYFLNSRLCVLKFYVSRYTGGVYVIYIFSRA